MQYEMFALALAGFFLFFKELMSKCLWSMLLYSYRGEFNYDNNESTPDKFLLHNPSVDSFTECYILSYSIMNVKWGFVYDEGFICKTSSWLSWTSFRNNRYPMPIPLKSNNVNSVIKILLTN